MTHRSLLQLLSVLLLSLVSFTALSAPKDAAATKKIDEAINVHYLATDFQKAEGQLLGIVKACGDACSPNVLGRAWMYVGIVRGCGNQDLAGAKEAFESAKAADPATALDTALATDEVKAQFEAVFGGGSAPPVTPTPTTPATTNDVTAAVAATTITCTPPSGAEVQTRRPIPISCTPPAGASKAVMAYKEFGGDGFTTIPMKLEGGTFRAAIPCTATKMAGMVTYTVKMQDATGNELGSISEDSFAIVENTSQPAPAFPGQAPPARCEEEVECPPGMPGCARAGGGGWGDSCTPAAPCKKGLYCEAGMCENAPQCEIDSDCASGRCFDGFCDMGDGSGSSDSVKKFWAGVHVAADLLWVSKDKDTCTFSNISSRKYACYPKNQDVPINGAASIPVGPDAGEVAQSGFVMATLRVLVSADYAITPSIALGARVGFAFKGGPPNATYNAPDDVYEGSKFLPIHAEGRGTYWIRSLGQPGIRPYVHLGGGMAQIDAKVVTTDVRLPDNSVVSYDVWKKVGQGFVTLGGGAMLPLGSRAGLVGNLNLMYMLPDSGIVVEPSLGLEMGF